MRVQTNLGHIGANTCCLCTQRFLLLLHLWVRFGPQVVRYDLMAEHWNALLREFLRAGKQTAQRNYFFFQKRKRVISCGTHCQVLISVWRQDQGDYNLVAKGRCLLVPEQFIDGVQLTRQKGEVIQNRRPIGQKRARLWELKIIHKARVSDQICISTRQDFPQFLSNLLL